MIIHRVLRTTFLTAALLSSVVVAQTATAPAAGDGSSGDPYQIATLDNLYWITQNNAEWDMYYIQTANIDASSTSGWDSESGFFPIGNGSTSFTGSYDGGNYTISGLTINRSSSDYVALFGFISNGTVKNVTLTSINITGQDYTAGLVGYSTGSGSSFIDNCSAAGAVTGRSFVGGLIGSTSAASTVSNCFADVTVISNVSGNNLGGFIGRHTQGSTISNSYSRGNVISDGDHVGGFAGNVSYIAPSSPTIANCYSTGDAFSYNRAGGFIGSILTATISNCYSVGGASIDGGSTVGGFVALNSSGTVSNCFWDTEASGNASSAAGTGKTTAEMKTSSTFTDAGWDFTNTWEILSTFYPRLQSIPDVTLPVQMTGFIAECGVMGVELRWRTTTETDNSGWDVERRPVSKEYGVGATEEAVGAWRSIGFVEGAGTSTSRREYSFSDKLIIENRQSKIENRYAYRLKQVDRSGAFTYSGEVEVEVGGAPRSIALSQNYPNPFNPSTTISFTVAEEGRTTLRIYSLLGQEVAILFDEISHQGVRHNVVFDASHLAAGTYFAHLESGSARIVRKLVLTK